MILISYLILCTTPLFVLLITSKAKRSSLISNSHPNDSKLYDSLPIVWLILISSLLPWFLLFLGLTLGVSSLGLSKRALEFYGNATFQLPLWSYPPILVVSLLTSFFLRRYRHTTHSLWTALGPVIVCLIALGIVLGILNWY